MLGFVQRRLPTGINHVTGTENKQQTDSNKQTINKQQQAADPLCK
jgi:hypothetical protein